MKDTLEKVRIVVTPRVTTNKNKSNQFGKSWCESESESESESEREGEGGEVYVNSKKKGT
jgi:hypothetical protein